MDSIVTTDAGMEGAWWPATVFLTDVPDSINLTTQADMDYDITKTIAFQGTPWISGQIVVCRCISRLMVER